MRKGVSNCVAITKKVDGKMKVIILAAGVGSRIKPLTDNCPKSLLKVGGQTILERMISHIQDCEINEIIFVLGYLDKQIKNFVKKKFPNLDAKFVINDKFKETNTGFSLMLTKALVQGESFIKFDADVIFDIEILKKLIESKYKNCLCIDKNINLQEEEIKVIVGENNQILAVSKTVNPKSATGESVGIEKISAEMSNILFEELECMMAEKKNHQNYYESAYEKIINKNIPFYCVDITGLKWTEIDTKEDFINALSIFA